MESLINDVANMSFYRNKDRICKIHHRYDLYKLKDTNSSQEKRRQRILAAQNKARYDIISHLRNVEEGITDNKPDESITDLKRGDLNTENFYKRPYKYRNLIMLNEWLVDVPSNFADTYLAIPCPVGKRCLIVCSKGITNCYGRDGKFLFKFQSLLPASYNRGYTLLDTIFYFTRRIFYVLDILVWKGQSFVDCEAQFRFHWLHNQFEEWLANFDTVFRQNEYKFEPLPYVKCDNESVAKVMATQLSFGTKLDGVMFFHKSSHYRHGKTPLVGWLKPYMIPEVLHIEIPEEYLMEKPPSYQTLSSYIKARDEIREKNIQKTKEKEKNEADISKDN